MLDCRWSRTGLRARAGLLVVLGIAAFGFSGRPGWAYTPESPEVRAMVDRAYRFMATSDREPELGGDCLVALTFVKDGKGESHPIVARAVSRAVAAARTGAVADTGSGALYSAGLCAIFLAEVDAQKYSAEIRNVLAVIAKAQKGHGGFSYPSYGTGDTSQTQYCVLAFWTAQKNGVPIPLDVMERTCNWLLRTQDPNGGWGYQGNDGGNNNRIQQSDVTQSIAAAGLGSVYVCADLLGFGPAPESAQSGYPPALKLIPKPGKKGEERVAKSKAVNLDQIRRSMTDGNRWFTQNLRMKEVGSWHFYFMYALERYMSFREAAEGREEKEPDWYNQGVELLQTMQ